RSLRPFKVSLKSAYGYMVLNFALQVLKKCHLAEIVRRDPRLLDALGIITEYDE
ncbi:hypothetical protein HN51_035147, partial [Arachis hypogaea]